MKSLLRFVAALVAFSPVAAHAGVVISEILYNPPSGADYEFVELHNPGAVPVDVSGWSFSQGIQYLFPAGSEIPAGGFVVLARSREVLSRVYPGLPPAAIVGEFEGGLANEGERLLLVDGSGQPQELIDYDDDAPWDFLADGLGASLERLCNVGDGSSPETWRASRVPSGPEEFGGSPGQAGPPQVCPAPAPVRPPVYISEVMYHPVLEEALDDPHEFVEIHNRGAEPVDLTGWRIAGGIDFPFPAGTVIAPGAYRVIARERAMLAAVTAYGLIESEVLGDYARSLDNGGDKVALISAEGVGVDSMTYEDDFPWPLAADALGAGEDWLRSDLLPLDKHRHLGHSLERVSFDTASNEISNWAPSPLDGATPGKANASARPAPLPVVSDLLVQNSDGSDRLVRAGKEVLLQAAFTPLAPLNVEVEHFLEDPIGGGERVIAAQAMTDDGASGDLVPGDRVFSAILPARPDNSIVRYRIRADLGAGMEVVSPRPTDPLEWYGYHVVPAIQTDTRIYNIFITPANWGRLWNNIQGGRVSGCAPSATWDQTVPIVFTHDGEVYDARARYQGSRWNRTNGPDIASWAQTRPSTGPLRALSWRVQLPRYKQLDGSGDLTLNKLTQGCPGYNAGVGYPLFAAMGLPASNTQFIRLHVNGGYYRYMIQLERPGEEMMRRYHREQAESDPTLPREQPGHLFKSVGCNCDEGPYGWGDWRVLSASCNHQKLVRYAFTYDRKTNGYADASNLMDLIEDMHAAKRQGNEAVRAFFAERFDLDLLLSYIAIMNWSVPFDDMFQNHFIYQRTSDGKWVVFPWDLDQNFGEWQGANSSVYMGEAGNPSNRSGWSHQMKDFFLKAYRQEFDDRLLLLNNTLLHPDNVSRLVDEVTARANPTEAQQAAAPASCSFPARATSFKAFAAQRHVVVNTQIANVELNAGVDQMVFAGTQVEFDASASQPDPGPEVTYSWSNGMTGDRPTAVFEAPGVHVITLTVRTRGIDFNDAVKVTVLPRPASAFQESGGLVAFEAEHFLMNERNGAANTWWDSDVAQGGYSGESSMIARQARRQTFPQRYVGVAPELRYALAIQTPGTYRVWLRAFSTSTLADSVYVGLNGTERPTTSAHLFQVDPVNWTWSSTTRTQALPQTLDFESPGLYLFSIWVRDSGQIIDKVVLAQDPGFTPVDAGPPESGSVDLPGPRAFVRGDADSTLRLNVSDAIRIILHLFGGMPIPCEDPADADDNGEVNVTDVITVLAYLFQRGPDLPAPHLQAGFDPTPDAFPCGETDR